MTRHASDSGLEAVPATGAPRGGSYEPAPPPRGNAAAPPLPGKEAAPPLRGNGAAPPLGREARRRIGRNLRLLYADVLNQPLPDRFTALLDGLSQQSDSREAS